MSKFIKLLSAAWAAGRVRNPDEGVLHLNDDEAKRLVDDGAGVDVTSDFTAEQKKALPPEPLTAAMPEPPKADPEPHQSEIAQTAGDLASTTGRKAAKAD